MGKIKRTAILIGMSMVFAAAVMGCSKTATPAAVPADVSEGESNAGNVEATGDAAVTEAAVATQVKDVATASTKSTTAENAKKKKDAVGKTEQENKKTESETEKKVLPEYTVTAYEEAKTMYASGSVNVRSGPSKDFDKVGGLARAQEVSATGQASTGWYEIVYHEGKAYVSDSYLQSEKPAEEPTTVSEQPQQAAQEAGQPVQAVTQVKNVAGVILVGDSRFVQMQSNVGENSCTWIAESGKGYKWFSENAVSRIDGCVGKGSKVLINLGVNDPGNVNNYLELVNAKAAEWVSKGAVVYYASVNPVWENPYVTEDQVHNFNSQLQTGLSGDIHFIDSHTYLESIGYKLVDGLHYGPETYQNLYAYFMSCL